MFASDEANGQHFEQLQHLTPNIIPIEKLLI